MEPSQLPDPTACQFRRFHHHHHHPLPHHHHYYHVLPQCPLHSYMLGFNNYHSPTCRASARSHPPSQNRPQTALSFYPPQTTLNFQISGSKLSEFSTQGVAHKEDEELEEEEHQQLYEEEEEEEEAQDPVFVLTDEWREFFAKSEAKRRLAKKQSRKEGKNQMEQ
ncbi:SKI/DACH domain-containing protein 1-like [Coffea eugenioides]|uniref:SKI/DACH domain-containing protein 1-like n=1 Tax=Coffea eugenioides TaxID=49369 RepID=UPI000F60F805|nr:SKI/DACH domain-containing protein 1-like [Coffea eugenioides]